jgi:hypothetical protein
VLCFYGKTFAILQEIHANTEFVAGIGLLISALFLFVVSDKVCFRLYNPKISQSIT